jgi:hypothetical protein
MTAAPARYAELARHAIAQHQRFNMPLERAISLAIERAIDEVTGETDGLPPIPSHLQQFRRVAIHLKNHGRADLGSISAALRQRRPAVCRTLARMVRRGWARRISHGIYTLTA